MLMFHSSGKSSIRSSGIDEKINEIVKYRESL